MVAGRIDIGRRVPRVLCLLLLLLLSAESRAEKKDFKGLFGNYRRDKFVENEGNPSDFGVNILLSTLIPVTNIVRSREGTVEGPLNYATFFDLELEFFMTLSYNWELFARIGYYDYDTRLENRVFTDPAQPLFHEFSMKVFPIMAGIKYRFGRDDIVPYIGAGVGIGYVERRASFDFNPAVDREVATPLLGELLGGFEFFFGARAGLRLELAVMYMKLSERTYNAGGGNTPIFTYRSNPFMVRYASGIFVLF